MELPNADQLKHLINFIIFYRFHPFLSILPINQLIASGLVKKGKQGIMELPHADLLKLSSGLLNKRNKRSCFLYVYIIFTEHVVNWVI